MKDYCGYDGNGDFYKVKKQNNSDEWLSECNQGKNCVCSNQLMNESKETCCSPFLYLWLATLLVVVLAVYLSIKTAL